MLDQRFGLRIVDLEPLGDDLFLVVGPLNETAFFPAVIAVWERPRGRGVDIEHSSAGLADPASREPLEENSQIEIEQHHRGQGRAHFREHPLQGLCLGNVPRKPVQNEALDRIGPAQALADHPQYGGIIDELSRVHGRLGAQTQFRAFGDRLAQQVARGYLGYAIGFDQ